MLAFRHDIFEKIEGLYVPIVSLKFPLIRESNLEKFTGVLVRYTVIAMFNHLKLFSYIFNIVYRHTNNGKSFLDYFP